DLFEKLIGVPGIGPRLALAVLSHLDPADLAEIVLTREITRLTRVPGIGPRTAERLLIDLGGILKAVPPEETARGPAGGGGGRRAGGSCLGARQPRLPAGPDRLRDRGGALRHGGSSLRGAPARDAEEARVAVEDPPRRRGGGERRTGAGDVVKTPKIPAERRRMAPAGHQDARPDVREGALVRPDSLEEDQGFDQSLRPR